MDICVVMEGVDIAKNHTQDYFVMVEMDVTVQNTSRVHVIVSYAKICFDDLFIYKFVNFLLWDYLVERKKLNFWLDLKKLKQKDP